MNPERFHKIRRILDRRQPDLTVFMDNVHKPHNFSAVVRTCEAVGIFEACAVWPQDTLRPHHMASGGAAKWVSVKTFKTVDAGTQHLRAKGFNLLAAHLSKDAVGYRTVDYTKPTAIVLGSELYGLGETTAATVDQHIVIPMHGMVESLNVSVAAAIILFEAERQRTAAGLYTRSRLDAATYRKTLFEWTYPTIAEYCQRHQLNYPPLDDDGNIIGEFRDLSESRGSRL